MPTGPFLAFGSQRGPRTLMDGSPPFWSPGLHVSSAATNSGEGRPWEGGLLPSFPQPLLPAEAPFTMELGQAALPREPAAGPAPFPTEIARGEDRRIKLP